MYKNNLCFWDNLFTPIKNNPIKAPNQTAKITAVEPCTKPRNQPIPRANLTSPKPNHLPFEMNHKKAKGKAISGPAQIFEPKEKPWKLTRTLKKEIKIKL